MGYQIKMVSEMLGIPKNTLIAWERRYSIVAPDRTAGGYRLYSDQDLAVLRRVQALLDQGFKVGEACRIVLDEASQPTNGHARGVAPDRDPTVEAVPRSDRAALARIKDELKQHLLAFDRSSADLVTARLLPLPFEQAIDEVYFPLLRDIGQQWELGRVTVVQEHYASAYCREKLLVMLNSVQSSDLNAPEVTCATPPGEHHELGLLALSLRLAIRGFRVTYLGNNVPTSDLVDHIAKRDPAALCLSMVHARARGEILAYARELRTRIPATTKIAIGGRATSDPGLHVEGVAFTGHGLPSWLQSVASLRAA